MSSEINIYIGPYIKIFFKDTDYIQEINGCPNEQCVSFKKSSSYKFCSNCGTQNTTCRLQKTGVLRMHHFLEDHGYEYFEDNFYIPEFLGGNDHDIILSTLRNDQINIDSDGGEVDLLGVDIDQKKSEFLIAHSTELDKMKLFFGDNMTIKYGVCSYWA